MKGGKSLISLVFFLLSLSPIYAQEENKDSLNEVVVTGIRQETDVRHLSMNVSVIDRKDIELEHSASVLPLLSEHVPGLFVTSRGVMGYGVKGEWRRMRDMYVRNHIWYRMMTRQQVAFLEEGRKIKGCGSLKWNFYTRFIPENYGFGAVTWLRK